MTRPVIDQRAKFPAPAPEKPAKTGNVVADLIAALGYSPERARKIIEARKRAKGKE